MKTKIRDLEAGDIVRTKRGSIFDIAEVEKDAHHPDLMYIRHFYKARNYESPKITYNKDQLDLFVEVIEKGEVRKRCDCCRQVMRGDAS
jgi:hypothetical protein